MNLEFSGELWLWNGPAPWHFVTVPEEECGELDASVRKAEGLALGDAVTIRLTVDA